MRLAELRAKLSPRETGPNLSIRRVYGGLTLVPYPRGESMGILRGLEEPDLVPWGAYTYEH